MKAIQVQKQGAALVDLTAAPVEKGFVAVQTLYSAVNYQDMLALTGRAEALQRLPLIAGSDAVGVVLSDQGLFRRGDKIFCTGAGLGAMYDGGLAEQVHLPLSAVFALPRDWSSKSAMLLGSAGFAAAQAILQLQQSGILPEQGELLITGASGAVGLWAVKIAAYLGYDVVAVTRNPALHESLLLHHGASRLLALESLYASSKALAKEQFAGGIDCLGGRALTAMLSQIRQQGAVAAIGVVTAPDFTASLLPFIVRGIALFGITTHCSLARREQVWQWLARHFDADFIATMPYQEIFLDEVLPLARRWQMLRAGRVIVRCAPADADFE